MLNKIISLLFVLTVFTSGAKKPVEFKLWDGVNPPVESGLTPADENGENPGWITAVATGELFVFPADNPNGMAVIMCPGGGYVGLAMEHEGKALAQPLNDQGVTLAVVKYRMPNGHPTVPADDVNRAYEIVLEHAGEWGIDPAKIGIGGASAGGHLASTIATHPEMNKFKPAFQFLLYPVITMKGTSLNAGIKPGLLGQTPTKEQEAIYSNELRVSPETPQAFIAVSADDSVVPVINSLNYVNALVDNGVPVSLHVYPTGDHGWGYNTEKGENQMWWKEFADWLNNLYAN